MTSPITRYTDDQIHEACFAILDAHIERLSVPALRRAGICGASLRLQQAITRCKLGRIEPEIEEDGLPTPAWLAHRIRAASRLKHYEIKLHNRRKTKPNGHGDHSGVRLLRDPILSPDEPFRLSMTKGGNR